MASIVVSGDTSGAVTITAPAVAGTTTLTLPTTSGTIVTTGGASSLTTSGNLTFTGTGNRITGDFSNATVANRVAFQTSTTNGATTVFAIPNGAGTVAGFFANNDSTLAAASSEGSLSVNGTTDVRVSSAIRPGGTYLPLTMYTGGSERLRIDTSGNVSIANSTARVRLDVRSDAVIAAPTPLANAVASGVFAIGDTVGSVMGLQLNGSSYDTYIQARNMGAGSTAYNLLLQPLGGNVGIGTTSPASKLNVAASEGLRTTNDGGFVSFYNTANSTRSGYLQIQAADVARLNVEVNQPLLIFTNSTERMRIASNGFVNIGTTAAAGDGKLSVESSGGNSSEINISLVSGAGNKECILNFGDNLTTAGRYKGRIFYQLDNSVMGFWTNTTERMRITSGGNLLLGATSGTGANERLYVYQDNANWINVTYNQNAAPYGVQIWYNATPNNSGNQFLGCFDSAGTQTQRASIRSNGGLANYSANDVNLSDAREKTNIELAGSYLDKICAIPVKTFNYIDQNLEEDDGLTLGVLAQDVQAVAPELVMESNWAGKDQPEKMRLSIYQTDLQYALMKCIQEQQQIINDLKARIETLEGAK